MKLNFLFFRHGGLGTKLNTIPSCLAETRSEVNKLNFIQGPMARNCKQTSFKGPKGFKCEPSDIMQLSVKSPAMASFMNQQLKRVYFFDAARIKMKQINKTWKS